MMCNINMQIRRVLESQSCSELVTHRKVSRMNYSRRYAEASALDAYRKRGLPQDLGDGDLLSAEGCQEV